MAFDPVGEFARAKKAFTDSRGADVPVGKKHERTGQLLIAPGKMVPRTTWGDVVSMGTTFLLWADPGEFTFLPASVFVRTTTYKRAKDLFEKWQPLPVMVSRFGLGRGGVELSKKIFAQEIYPHNEEFWGYGADFAAARSAAGAVPTKFSIAVESVKEAIKELPDTVGKALDAVIPKLPSLTPLAEIVKWGAIGGGLFMLYWYVLRPKKTA